MSSTKGLINTLMLAIAALAITACVPKATEKKAVCGTNQAFSTVSRSCYSIEELRTKPIGTFSKASMTEETSQPLILTYTDGNKDSAISCEVTPTSSNLELISPSVADGTIFIKANDVNLAATLVATQLGHSSANMTAALDKAKASRYYPTVMSQLGFFKSEAARLLALGMNSQVGSVPYYYTDGQAKMVILDSFITKMTNRCECSGGVCTTIAIPKLNQTGTAGFSYTITDVDGEGAAKTATVTISALTSSKNSHLRPIATSAQVTFEESLDNKGKTSDFTISDGGDVSTVDLSTLKYKFKVNGSTYTKTYGPVPDANPAVTSWYGVTPNGYVFGCMDLNATSNTASNDKTCKYVPKSGNAWDSLHTAGDHPNAFKAIGSVASGYLTFTAKAPGTAGNNISVRYFNLQNASESSSEDSLIINPETYGLVQPTEEAFIRVVGNSIRIYINPGLTSSDHIQTLVTNHKQANKLVTVTGGSAASFPIPSVATPSAVLLTGGLAAFDEIPYIVTNSIGDSENDGIISVRVTRADDTPILGASGAYTAVEDQAVVFPNTRKVVFDLDATYSDNDTDGVNYTNTCTIDMSTPDLYNGTKVFSDYVNSATALCTCSGSVCTAELDPLTDVSRTSPFNFNYRITSTDNTKVPAVSISTAYKSYQLYITPVNDAPEVSTSIIPTITAIPAQIMAEGASKSFDVYIGPGGSGYEATQTLTFSAVSSNLTLLPQANLVVTDVLPLSQGLKRVTFTPAPDQSGSASIKIYLTDNGQTAGGGVDTLGMPLGYLPVSLTVTPVNNPPVFKSSIIAIQTNEGGAVQSDPFQIDEDSGSSADENYQSITIDSIESDNQNVLPDSAIEIFYDMNKNGVEDLGEARTIGSVLEGVGNESFDVKLRNLYLKLDPVDGISGNANITMKISDHIVAADPMSGNATYLPLTQSKTISFSFIVHPIAALHGGWNNISSVGIKTDKNSVPVTSAEIQCNYNLKADTNNCGIAKDCVGDVSPNSTVVPNAANVIYWDKTSLRCYRSTSNNEFSWVDMNTSCPITRESTACSGNNCISPASPVGSIAPDIIGQFQLASNTNKCYVSTGKAVGNWVEYVPAKVTLSWKPFIIVGSGPYGSVQVDGWNVYRRDAQSDYNFKDGHLQKSGTTSVYTITDPSVRTFTDTTAIAGRVYYYVVRPVDSKRHYPTYTPESFSEVRVIAAPKNYSFVHRWIVNQEMCNGMGITTTTTPYHVDQTSNFRCEYSGPGSVDIGGVDYYDIGKDLLVDSQESGCAYAAAPKCSPGTNGCIGIGNPDGVYTADLNDLYYDRSKGVCYVNTDGADEWKTLQVEPIIGTVADKTTSALNAPITNISRTTAHNICDVRTKPDISFILNGAVATDTLNSKVQLPNKKDYMAYSSQRIDLTDPEITTMEQGFALNIQSRCNGSSASGLETAYTDGAIPTTSFLFSLPGTFSSGIRSLYTGSVPVGINKGTEACVSRFGIQDLYGNVAEWVDDGMTCDPDAANSKVCTVDQVAGSSFTSSDFGTANPYSFNNTIGPFNEGGDSIVTYPNFTLSVLMDASQTTLTIGPNVVYYPTSGIVYIGTEEIAYTGRNATQLTGLTRGYNSTTAAGHAAGAVVALTVLNDDSYLTNWTFGDQFFGATNFNYPLGLPLSSNINQASFSAYLDWVLAIGPSNGITTNQLHEDGIIVNGSTGASKSFAVGGSYLSGNRAGRFSSELISNSVINRPDVGFRCIVPINPADTDNAGDYPVDDKYTYPP